MSWDPRSVGARCDVCPFGPTHGETFSVPYKPVPMEDNGSGICLVSQSPGRLDVERRRPMVDGFGVEIMRALDATGTDRRDVSWTCAMACQPPGGDLKRFEAKLKVINRKRRRAGEDEIPHPATCCRPRLLHDLQDVDGIISLGQTATLQLLRYADGQTSGDVDRKRAGILKTRGTLTEVPAVSPEEQALGRMWKVVPTVANYLHSRAWIKVFRVDVNRAMSWFRGELSFAEPEVYVSTSPADLQNWLAQYYGKAVLCDVETSGRRAMTTNLRCIGVGDEKRALVVPIRSSEPPWEKLVTREQEQQIATVMAAYMEDPATTWVGHNFGYFDRLVLESWTERVLGRRASPASIQDTLLWARAVDAELPKDLGTVVSLYVPGGTPAWKADHTAVNAASDAALWQYNALDVALNSRAVGPLARLVEQRQQERVLKVDHGMQAVCVGLHRNGMWVDQELRQAHDVRLVGELRERLDAVHQAMQDADLDPYDWNDIPPKNFQSERTFNAWVQSRKFNPSSPDQVRRLLFDVFQLEPPPDLSAKEIYTDSGERTTGKAILGSYVTMQGVPGVQKAVIEAIRQYKKRVKQYGTYVRKFDPMHEDSVISEIDQRVHSNWNVHGTLVGRLSSSGPNTANVPEWSRDMYMAREGHWYVYADWDQLHLRIIANGWGIPSLLEAFRKDLDPHALFAGLVFGDRFWKADGIPDGPRGVRGDYKGQAKKFRKVSKTARYAGAYDANPKTIYRVVKLTENGKGELIYGWVKPAFIEALYDAWHSGEPEWKRAWAAEKEAWKYQGYLLSPILGRRVDFRDGWIEEEDLWDDEDDGIRGNVGNKLVNYRILSGETDIANPATLELVQAVPFEYAGPGTGLVQHNYDSMILEIPHHDVARVGRIMQEIMNRRIPGHEIVYTAEVKVGKSWQESSMLDLDEWIRQYG